MPRGIPNIRPLKPAEALARIKQCDEAEAKAILCCLVGAWAGKPEWITISLALGRPKPAGETIASAK